MVDDETGLLLITEALLDMLNCGDSVGFETRFHWKPRGELVEADALSKLVDRNDSGLRPAALNSSARSSAPGTWTASPPSTTPRAPASTRG